MEIVESIAVVIATASGANALLPTHKWGVFGKIIEGVALAIANGRNERR